ncbi:MBOAT family protein [Alphaproteobacteria bacterium LSUCC0744]
MIFNSLTYLLLLLIVATLYWILPYRARLLTILFSSLIFYGFWRIEFLPVLLFSTFVDWYVAQHMSGRPERSRFYLLLTSLAVNLGLLFYFKYLIFFADNATGLANLMGAEIDPIALKIILPLGISFYTFQTISYTIDVYRRHILPERDFVLYACYVTFFPQLVAGPVLRASEVIHQFANRVAFSSDFLFFGIRRILYGLFLKVVFADNIAPLVDNGYSMPLETMSALDVWTLAFLFGFQIYFDFSAYSHIALGSARLMGITFPENFNFPYLASSPKDFWKRWHISLSSWIRDYLYLPLAGLKVHNRSTGGLGAASAERKHIKSLFLSWVIMGMWHGANWTFLLWGVFHAVVIILYRLIEPHTRGLAKQVRWLGGLAITLPLMMLAWVPFRAESVSHTFVMWGKIFDPSAYLWLGMRENTYLITALFLLGIFLSYTVKEAILPKLQKFHLFIAVADILLVALMTSLVIIFLRPINQFIYFQF